MAKRRSKGDGSIYFDERKKRFIGQIANGYDENGKRKRVTVSGKTKQEVLEKIKNIDYKIFSGTFVDKSDITVYHLAKQLLDDKLNQNEIQQPTYYRHLETLKILAPIYNTPLQGVSEMLLNSFFNSCLNYSQSSLKKIYALLSSTFSEARKRKIIIDNPMEFIKCPKSRNIAEPVRAFTREDQLHFTDVLTSQDINYSLQMLLSLSGGFRMGEINALHIEDVNFKNNTCYVHRTISRGRKVEAVLSENTKTEKGNRCIPLTSAARDILKIAIGDKKNGLIFTHNNKLITTNQVSAQFRRVLEKYNILDESIINGKIDLHSLRHTFGTRCVEAGLPPEVLKELLGHTDITITMNTYYYATKDHILSNLLRAENVLNNDGIFTSIFANKNTPENVKKIS